MNVCLSRNIILMRGCIFKENITRKIREVHTKVKGIYKIMKTLFKQKYRQIDGQADRQQYRQADG
jgi:hypothetical protein